MMTWPWGFLGTIVGNNDVFFLAPRLSFFSFLPHVSAVEEASVAKTYALHTILPPSTYAKHVEQPKTTALKGIIATVVCIIQGGGGRIDEGGKGGRYF